MRWLVAVISVVVGCGGAARPAPPVPVGNVAPEPKVGDDDGVASRAPEPPEPVPTTAATAAPAGPNPPPAGCNAAAATKADVLDLDGDGQPDVHRYYGTDNGTLFVQCKLTDLDSDGKWDVARLFAPDGSVTTELYDLDFDGVPDKATHPSAGTGTP